MNKTLGVLLLTSFLAACVTINIYFPAAAAQEAADEIIDDVWQLQTDQEQKEATPQTDTNAETPAAN